LRGVVEILPDAESERRIPCNGPYQSEILMQVVDIFPSARALELGLVPQAAMPSLVEGFAVNRTDWLEAFPEHASVGSAMGILIDILDEANDEILGRGCALWFLVSGTFNPDDPAFLNLNAQPQVFGLLDHQDVGLASSSWTRKPPSSSGRRQPAMRAPRPHRRLFCELTHKTGASSAIRVAITTIILQARA
jgi:hypothetical protein